MHLIKINVPRKSFFPSTCLAVDSEELDFSLEI